LRYYTAQLYFVGTAAATTASAAVAACCGTQHSVRLAVLAKTLYSQQLQAVNNLIVVVPQAGETMRCWRDNKPFAMKDWQHFFWKVSD
jgi:hypothetical protein